ncbi:hypothetical protein PM082_019634 [Marasmius tenuissimus]|nr:hypothetical protein PM082_019634 [Marasmius tenuissimus]
MSGEICSIPGNPDVAGAYIDAQLHTLSSFEPISVAGIGVRASVYAQTCLAMVFLALIDLKNPDLPSSTPKQPKPELRPKYIQIFKNLEQRIFMFGFAVIINAIIELNRTNGLTPYHSLIVLNIGFINSWVGGMLLLTRAESKAGRSIVDAIWLLLHSIFYGSFGIYFWARKARIVDHYADNPDSCRPLTYFWVFQPVLVTNPVLKTVSLTFFAFVIAVPVIGLALYAFIHISGSKCLSTPFQRVKRSLPFQSSEHVSRYDRLAQFVGSFTRSSPAIFALFSTEYIVRLNAPNVTARDNDWTYGQTLALLMTLVAVARYLNEWRNVSKDPKQGEIQVVDSRGSLGGDVEKGKVDVSVGTEVECAGGEDRQPQQRGSF